MDVIGIAASKLTFLRETSISLSTPVRVPANFDRLAVILQIPEAATAKGVISSSEANATNDIGYVYGEIFSYGTQDACGTVDISVWYAKHGVIVTQELWVRSSIGTGIVTEVIAQPGLAELVNRLVDFINHFKDGGSPWTPKEDRPTDPLDMLRQYLSRSQGTQGQ